MNLPLHRAKSIRPGNFVSYYAYGLPVQDSKVSITTPYLYSSKEFYSLKGINLYDFHARTYAPDECRFWQPDPLATENHGVSPYIFCNGDPINYVDPTGEKVYYVDMAGRLVTSDEILGKIANRSEYEASLEGLDRVVIIDQDGKIIRESDTFKEGTIGKTIQNKTLDKNGASTDLTSFVVRGDAAAINLFEFFANTITGSEGYEYFLLQTGKSGENGLNFITTSHLKGRDVGAGWLFNYQLRFGYSIRKWIHSHPESFSYNGDLDARNRVNRNRYPKIIHMIYHVPTKAYLNYTHDD